MSLLQGTPGEIVAADGTPLAQGARAGRSGDLIVSELHGRLFEQSFRKRLFTTTNAAYTYLATSNTPLAAGTGVPLVGLYNPINSGILLEVVKLKVATTSGTPGGPLFWNYVANAQSITAAPAGTAQSTWLGSSGGSKAQLFNGTALTGSTFAGVNCGLAWAISAVSAAGNSGAAEQIEEGELVVPPGVLLALCGTAVGTTHVVSATVSWVELPYSA